jgi:hypothetical protein
VRSACCSRFRTLTEAPCHSVETSVKPYRRDLLPVRGCDSRPLQVRADRCQAARARAAKILQSQKKRPAAKERKSRGKKAAQAKPEAASE